MLREYSHSMSTSDPNLVQPDEILSRYIFAESQYRSSDHSIRHTAFMPPGDLRLSVFRTSGLNERDIWGIGEDVGRESKRNLHGRGDFLAGEVTRVNLDIDPDDIPLRHANVVGWPPEKHRQQLIAQKLASVATLKLKPSQPS